MNLLSTADDLPGIVIPGKDVKHRREELVPTAIWQRRSDSRADKGTEDGAGGGT